MPKTPIAVTLACTTLLVGCGAGVKQTAAPRSVTRADLPRMLLPKKDLGALAKGLKLDRDRIGGIDNEEEAENTVDPADTARALARAGRVHGYALEYSAGGPHSTPGVLSVSNEVELFRTEKAASVYLNKQTADFERFRGRRVERLKLARVDPFDVDVGDDGSGVRVLVVSGGNSLFGTLIGFRRGRIVGSTMVVLRRELVISGDVKRIADALDHRIMEVLSGESRGSVLPSIRKARRDADPRPLTLEPKNLPLRMTLVHRGYFPVRGTRSYQRNYVVLEGRLAGSEIFFLSTMAQVFKSSRAAEAYQKYINSPEGRILLARTFSRQFSHRFGLLPGRVSARRPPWRGDDTAAIDFFYRVPKGRIEGVLLTVRRGQISGGVIVLGFDADFNPAAVLTLRAALRARLDSK